MIQDQLKDKTWTDAQNQRFILALEQVIDVINALSFQVYTFIECFNTYAYQLEHTMNLSGDSKQSDGEQYTSPTQTFVDSRVE